MPSSSPPFLSLIGQLKAVFSIDGQLLPLPQSFADVKVLMGLGSFLISLRLAGDASALKEYRRCLGSLEQTEWGRVNSN